MRVLIFVIAVLYSILFAYTITKWKVLRCRPELLGATILLYIIYTAQALLYLPTLARQFNVRNMLHAFKLELMFLLEVRGNHRPFEILGLGRVCCNWNLQRVGKHDGGFDSCLSAVDCRGRLEVQILDCGAGCNRSCRRW